MTAPDATACLQYATGSASKLTAPQRELYEAMLNGCTCFYMPYAGRFNPSAYYFRTDNMKRCTAQAKALLKRGLVEKYKEDWRGHKLRVKQPNAQRERPEANV